MTVCGDRAYDASGKQFLREDIERLVRELEEAKKNDAFKGLKKKKREKLEDSELSKLIEKRNRMLNAAIEIRLLEAAEMADRQTGNPALGIHAKISGINSPFKGSMKSVHANQVGLIHKYAGGLLHDLRKADLHVKFNNMKGDFEREVARALAAFNTKGADMSKVDASKDAVEIARIMHKYQSAAVRRENMAGAFIRIRQGYIVRQNHSPRLMIKKGRKAWKDYVRSRLNFELMGIDKADREDFLNDAYAAIKSGIRITEDVDDVTKGFKGPGNMAKRESANRVLLFKSADDWYDYDKEFGYGSLREAYVQDLFRAARATSVMTEFGTNPNAMLEKVKGTLLKKHRNDDKKVRRLQGRTGAVTLQAALDEVTGDVNIGAPTTPAQINSAFRALQTMAKLGGAWVSAWADIPFMASNRMFQGAGFFQAWGDAIRAPIEGMTFGEKQAFADLLGAGLENQLGDFMSRMHAQDEVAGATSKMLHYFFKLNLLGPWTSANKRGMTMVISRDLARNVSTPFSKLPDDLRRILDSYGINSVKWDIAQKAVFEGPDGRSYIVPSVLDDLDINTDFPRREEYGDVFSTQSTAARQRLVTDTQESLVSLLTNEVDHAVPSPGARERGVLRQGYRPGTVEGEAARYVTQFKSFGISVLTRVMGRQIYGSGSKTLREQLSKGVGANLGLINAIATTSFMGYLVLQAKEMLAGREPKDLSPELLIKSVVQGGGFGLYGDFILGESYKYGGSPLETVAGPFPTAMADAFLTAYKMRDAALGGDVSWKTDLVRLAKSNMPLQNLFYTKQVTDYLVWYHLLEAANPGYLRRMERRYAQEGQEMYMKPSQYIATGGGFR